MHLITKHNLRAKTSRKKLSFMTNIDNSICETLRRPFVVDQRCRFLKLIGGGGANAKFMVSNSIFIMQRHIGLMLKFDIGGGSRAPQKYINCGLLLNAVSCFLLKFLLLLKPSKGKLYKLPAMSLAIN